MTFSIPLLATEHSQKTSVSRNYFLFYIVATGASFHPATSFVAEKLMQEKLYEVSFVALWLVVEMFYCAQSDKLLCNIVI